ncbi:MAG TPA: ribonuclease Z [Blastocatellia bacterium]|nr:ribonuclease Z [Blastocatellia bacterium]
MSTRKFIALGTASQVPTRQRNHNGYFLKWDDEGILFDPGEGTQRQMIFANVTASEITKICITHFHGDHCLGLAGVIQRLSLDKVSHAVEVYYPASGQKYFENLKDASIFYNTANIQPRPITEPGVIFRNRNFTLETQALHHSVESWGYRLQEIDTVTMLPDKLAALGIRGADVGKLKAQGTLEVNGQVISLAHVSVPKLGKVVAFVMDTGMCEAAISLAKNADLLICESTYLAAETAEAESRGHLTAPQAATIAQAANAKLLVLTHFSQRYNSVDDFVREAYAIHSNVIAVQDGEVVTIPR